MVSNLQQSLSGLYEIAKSLNAKIKNLDDYTAFEVFVTDTEISQGTLYKNLPEEIKMYVPSTYLNEALDYKIPASLSTSIYVRDNHNISESNVIVDFGDGTTPIPIQDSSVEAMANETYKFTHTYAEKGKYIIKIFGDTYFNFKTFDWDYSETEGDGHHIKINGRVCRCLEDDLPIAKCVTSLVQSFVCNPCLFKINIIDSGKIFRKLTSISNFQYIFANNYNLLQVKGFKGQKFSSYYKPEWSRNLVGMFNSCFNLKTCDFKAVQSNDYRELYVRCENLTSSIESLLPDNFKEKSNINLGEMFAVCEKLTGTVPAKILWEDPEYKPIYTNGTLTGFEPTSKFYWAGNATPFKNASETIRAQVPTSWGGTNEEIEAKLQAKYWKQSSDGEFELKFNELLEYVNQQIQILKDQIMN